MMPGKLRLSFVSRVITIFGMALTDAIMPYKTDIICTILNVIDCGGLFWFFISAITQTTDLYGVFPTARMLAEYLLLRYRCGEGNRGTGGFNRVDYFGGGFADTFQRGFQLRQFLVAAPAGDIGKGIVRGVDAEMLADHIGNAFCLHLAGMVVLVRLSDNLAVFYRQGMELGMDCLVDQRL